MTSEMRGSKIKALPALGSQASAMFYVALQWSSDHNVDLSCNQPE